MQRILPAAPVDHAPLSAMKPEESAHQIAQILRQAPAAARKVLRAIVSAQERHTLFPSGSSAGFYPGQTVVVAVSGGADSICLLHSLHQLAPAWGLSLHVAHLDHALRPESADDAAFVASIAHQYSLPLTTTRLTDGILDDDPAGLEGAARSARYAFLRQVVTTLEGAPIDPSMTGAITGSSTESITVVAAHHQDDQAETLLMHLLQGSGLHGLAGMAWVGALPDDQLPAIRLVRPLLAVARAAIHDYLHSYGLQWREDESNRDVKHLRNQLRHQLLPLLATINPNIHAALARTADLLAAEADHASRRDQAALATLTVSHTPSTRMVLNLFPLTQYDLATQRGVLCQAFHTLGIDLRTAGMDGIEAILAQAETAKTNIAHPLIAGWAWTRLQVGDAHHLSIHRQDALPVMLAQPHAGAPLRARLALPVEGVLKCGDWHLLSAVFAPEQLPDDWRSRTQRWRIFCDADLCGDLYLTTFRAGMTIAPLGMGGHQRNLGDIFTDHKIPAYARSGWPIVVKGDGTVVWQCGLLLSELVRIQPTTRQVRQLRWQLETPK